MFNIFKYKEIKEERDELLLENAKLLIEIDKYSKADRMLAKIVEEKLDLRKLDLSTDGAKASVASHATAALNNPILKYVLDNGRYRAIMSTIKEARDYPEVVQKRANLLFIDVSILKALKDLSALGRKPKESDEEEDPDLAFVNN